jgi:hypothetical protein
VREISSLAASSAVMTDPSEEKQPESACGRINVEKRAHESFFFYLALKLQTYRAANLLLSTKPNPTGSPLKVIIAT